MEAGIVSYGVSIPRCRIHADEILRVWRNTHPQVLKRMGFNERCVLYPDQDTITLSIDAGMQALERTEISSQQMGALILGTGTNPYATKASVTVIGEALGLPREILSFDLQFAGKSGSAAIITALAMVQSGQVDYAMAIGADAMNRHIHPGHQMEYGASAGAAAFILGKEEDSVIATIGGHTSYAQDLSDFFRVEGERYLQLGGGMTAYAYGWGLIENMVPAGENLFKQLNVDTETIDCCAIHQHNAMVPKIVAGYLGLEFKNQVSPYILTSHIGDCGAASCLIPLAYILDESAPEKDVLLASYGSGAGSDYIYLKTTDNIKGYPNQSGHVNHLIEDKLMLDYGTVQKYEYKYVRPKTIITGYL